MYDNFVALLIFKDICIIPIRKTIRRSWIILQENVLIVLEFLQMSSSNLSNCC